METTPSARATIPGSGSQLAIVAKYEFRNYFGSRRFYILLGIALLISGLLTVLVWHYQPPSFLQNGELGFYASWWGNSSTIMIILSGIFFGGDAISTEFQNRTGYFLVPNPIRRSTIYVAKWISAFVAASIILGIFLLITVVNGVGYFGLSFPYELGESIVFAFIYLAAVMGFTFFFSSLFRSTSYSILVSAILFLFIFNLLQTLISTLVQIEPWFILTYGASIIANVLTVPYPLHEVTSHFPRGITLTTFNATIPEGLAIMLAYCLVTAVLGLVFFERKDFT